MSFKFIRPISQSNPIDLNKYLTAFLKELYGEKTLSRFKKAIEYTDNLRNQELFSSSNILKSDRKKLSEYYLILKSLEPIIAQERNQYIFVNNEWSHSKSKNPSWYERFSDNRFSFEITNVLFSLAMNILENTDQLKFEIRDNLQNYMDLGEILLGCFAEMKKYSEIDDLGSVSCLLSPGYLEIIINKYLIDIQFTFIYHGPQDDNEKLKQMCSFTECCASETIEALSKQQKILIDEELIRRLKYYVAISRSRINNFQAFIEKDESRLGNSLAYLKLSIEQINKYIMEDRKHLSAVTKKNENFYNEALEENERTYKSVIPKSVEYLHVKKLQIVKPAILNNETLMGGELCDVAEEFKKLVPVDVRKATKSFFLRITQLISKLAFSSQKNEFTLNDALAKLNIPAYFEKCKENTLPPSIAKKVNLLSLTNGIESVEKNFDLIDNLYKENNKLVCKAIDLLTNEKKKDNRYRALNKSYRGCLASLHANKSFWVVLLNLAKSLLKSKTSNKLLKEKFQNIYPSLVFLTDNQSELCDLNNEKNRQICQLNPEILDRIHDLHVDSCRNKHEELELLKKFEKTENEIEILFSDKFKNNGFLDIEQGCQELINEYQPTTTKIEKLSETQASIAFELNEYIERFNLDETYLTRILRDFNSYILIQKSINEAILFYQEIKIHSLSILDQIDSFCISQAFEANKINEMIKYYKQNSKMFVYNQKRIHFCCQPTEKYLQNLCPDYFEKYFPIQK